MLDMTTTQSLGLFGKSLVGNNYSQNSIRAYTDDVRQFIEWVKGNRIDWDKPVSFSRVDIIGFLNFLADKKATGVTRVRKLAAIRKFFTFLRDNAVIAGNPAETIKGPIREERDPEVLYRNEYKALLYEAQGNIRDYAILMLFLQTGLRVGELVNLKLDDIDIENKMLIVRQGKGKKDRTIPLEEQSLGALNIYLDDKKGQNGIVDFQTLFLAKNGTSMDVRTVRWMVHKYVQKAGIRKKASVHTLRHTFGTHKVDKGMTLPALQELLGHKKMETTYKYVHLAKTSLRQQQEQTSL